MRLDFFYNLPVVIEPETPFLVISPLFEIVNCSDNLLFFLFLAILNSSSVILFQIFYYSASLYKDAGLDAASATHATSGVGGVMVLMTLITIPLMDRAGRRTLHLIGLGGMCLFSVLITVALALKVRLGLGWDFVEGYHRVQA